jgi:hypothetical protein
MGFAERKNSIVMKKTYQTAELQIVRVAGNDIVTTSVTTHNEKGNGVQLSPSRNRSIWD